MGETPMLRRYTSGGGENTGGATARLGRRGGFGGGFELVSDFGDECGIDFRSRGKLEQCVSEGEAFFVAVGDRVVGGLEKIGRFGGGDVGDDIEGAAAPAQIGRVAAG